MVNKDNIGWTYAYCSQCGELHSIYDKEGKYNEKIPSMLCDKCKYDRKLDRFLKENKVKDKKIIKEFKKLCNERNRRFTSALNEAIKNIKNK